MSEPETCGVCGGDGRINTAHQTTSCPACRGSGRKSSERVGFHDVTRTKPSHHAPRGQAGKPPKKTAPSTPAGRDLADAVDASGLAEEAKQRLKQSIIDYEDQKGGMTKTFARLLRRQLKDGTS